MASPAATISIQETLHLLDGPFSSFAEGVAEDRYALWLGSGISLGRVEGLKQVVPRVIEFLRAKVTGAHNCRFRKSLDVVLNLAQLSDAEKARVDFARPFSDWPDADTITGRLIGKYASLLDTEVDGEEEDFLLWNAVDIVATFANPHLEPDVEHICIAILVLEGVASDIASANWDGLIERAVSLLAPGYQVLLVSVRPEDLREAALRSRLVKFHGCAVKAASDETIYRPYLIGRQSQINDWMAQAENKAMVNHLIGLVASKPTLMMGLSAQDANIQHLFSAAKATMEWPWPGERPSYLFSNEELGVDHKTLLKIVYRDAWTPATRDEIAKGALVRAYAKPLLVALVLQVICSKLKTLIDLAPGGLAVADQRRLHQGVLTIRDVMAATAATADKMEFVRFLIEQNGRALALFREGQISTTPYTYNPITTTPVQKIAGDAGLSASGLTEAAVATGILGLGVSAGDWTLNAEDTADPEAGMLRITGAASSARVFFVVNSYVSLRLQHNGHVADADRTILIHSKEKAATMRRSPRSAPGRTGRTGLREFSVSTLLDDAMDVDELMQRFREEMAL